MNHLLVDIEQVKKWIEKIYSDFLFDIVGIATSKGEILPLNLEPGTLGNIIEGLLIAFINQKIGDRKDTSITEGGNRFYPDLEITGPLLNNKLLALDIKAARRNEKNRNRTQSRMTLYSFGTYLKHQGKKFPQIIRPFNEYAYHLDLIAIFDVDNKNKKVSNFELLVVEPWKIASTRASSATRDYVGAIMEIDKMRANTGGEFSTQQEFYDHWAKISRRGEKAERPIPDE
ncbi:MAG: type II restriction endonuclease [Candidatus Peregrinibacteria bacterium Greene1014_49]|nr:MAG: type II restriction endonuclease [Candidatus Peregrinibacteria bacterium Greene1014_49]